MNGGIDMTKVDESQCDEFDLLELHPEDQLTALINQHMADPSAKEKARELIRMIAMEEDRRIQLIISVFETILRGKKGRMSRR